MATYIDSWLKPNGEIVEVGQFYHNEYASNLLEEEMELEDLDKYMRDNFISYPYEVLHKRGWIRIKYSTCFPKITILGGCIDLTKPMHNTMDPAMNEKQLRVAKRLCEELEVPLHAAINDSRFW